MEKLELVLRQATELYLVWTKELDMYSWLVPSIFFMYLDTDGYRTAKLKAIIFGKKVTAKWSISDKKIVSVSAKGKIPAKKAGIAYIKVKAGGQT